MRFNAGTAYLGRDNVLRLRRTVSLVSFLVGWLSGNSIMKQNYFLFHRLILVYAFAQGSTTATRSSVISRLSQSFIFTDIRETVALEWLVIVHPRRLSARSQFLPLYGFYKKDDVYPIGVRLSLLVFQVLDRPDVQRTYSHDSQTSRTTKHGRFHHTDWFVNFIC